MSRLFNLKSLVLAAVLTGGLSFANTASASDCYAPRCVYKTATTWKLVEQPYTRYATKYDHCRKPNTSEVIAYRTVKVPVTQLVKVCY